jgi:very-short-patch-repair endonuclease
MVAWKSKADIARARSLRLENATLAERRLWQRLKGRQMGAKFRRQHPFGPYVLDFVCLEAGLVIELDGGQHGLAEHAAHDEGRTAYLEARGLSVMRFWNPDVIDNPDGVCEAIAAALATRTAP